MLGPKRSILGCGEPVPKRVTFKVCAGAAKAKAAIEISAKRLLRHGCLLNLLMTWDPLEESILLVIIGPMYRKVPLAPKIHEGGRSTLRGY